MGGGNAFVLLNVCPCHSYAKLGENEKMRYICGWPWGGIFSGGQAQTGAVDRSGSGHQSCNSCYDLGRLNTETRTCLSVDEA